MHPKILLISLLSFLVSGCLIGAQPKNSEEYRVAIKSGAYGSLYQEFTIEKPYSQSVKILKKQADKCLNKARKTTTCHKNPALIKICDERVTVFKGIVSENKNMTTLMTGSKHGNTLKDANNDSNLLWITAVIDIAPGSKNSTQVMSYGSKQIFSELPNITKLWLSGKNMGCPDL